MERGPNCVLEEEISTRDCTVSFGFFDQQKPDFLLRSKEHVSIAVVFPTTAILPNTELVWNYAGVIYPDSAQSVRQEEEATCSVTSYSCRRPASPGY